RSIKTTTSTCSKVTLDQLLSEQVHRNIVKALGGKGRRKDKISSKEVVFTKADESSYVLAPETTSDSESECDSQEPLLPLSKLIGAAPSSSSESLISLSELTLNMADLTIDTPDPRRLDPDSSTEKLLLTLMKEVKGLKRQIEILLGTPISSFLLSFSKAFKQKTWFGTYKHCEFRNHLSDDCYSKPKCSTCGSTDHLTKEHLEHAAVKKTLNSGCSRHMSGIKQYLHKYSKVQGPKMVFGDDSSGDTEGYGSLNCNGITFMRVAYVNGLKHNLMNISQLCDANYKVLFTKTQGTIYNQNDEVVLIAPRRRDVIF
nr:retrovirus-related Pol polyprotein from transposon TNT 1-94 [Tanacetum cinerariifolium]